MMGNKKLSTILSQLKKHADPIASLEGKIGYFAETKG